MKTIKFGLGRLLDTLIGISAQVGKKSPAAHIQYLTKGSKVLMLSLDNIGDAIMATPAIEALKSAYPDSKLSLITRPASAPVFQDNPFIDEVLLNEAPWWSPHPLLGSLSIPYWIGLLRKIRKIRKEKYAAIIDLRGDIRHILFFGATTRPEVLIAYEHTGGKDLLSYHIQYDSHAHEIDKKIALLKFLGINGMRPQAKIWLLQEEILEARKLLKSLAGNSGPPFVLIDPGGKAVQRWSVESFAHLARNIWENFRKPVLISAGPAYTRIAKEVVRQAGAGIAKLLDPMSLRQAVSLVAICDLVISADTGIAHIASAVGTRTITLFGPTNPERFWHGINGSQVVCSPLRCSDLGLHEKCRFRRNPVPGACMEAITVKMVEGPVFMAISDAIHISEKKTSQIQE